MPTNSPGKKRTTLKTYSFTHSWHCIFTVSSFLFEFVCLQYRRQQLIQEFSLQATRNPKEQSLPWEVNSCSASQAFIRILWNPRDYYNVHNSLTLVPTLSHTMGMNMMGQKWKKALFHMFHALIRCIKFIKRQKKCTCQWSLCNKITFTNPSAFVGLFNKFYERKFIQV